MKKKKRDYRDINWPMLLFMAIAFLIPLGLTIATTYEYLHPENYVYYDSYFYETTSMGYGTETTVGDPGHHPPHITTIIISSIATIIAPTGIYLMLRQKK